MSGFLDFLKLEQPLVWQSIEKAATEGLIYVDEGNDAVTATNRLLLVYPGLHQALDVITQNWIDQTAKEAGSDLIRELLREAPDQGTEEEGREGAPRTDETPMDETHARKEGNPERPQKEEP